MNKIKNLSEDCFLKLFYGFITLCFLVAAPCMPDRSTMLSGFASILTSPAKITTNYFALGGYAATFLNAALVCMIFLGLMIACKATANNGSTLAFLLTAGFCSWGINVVNIWFTIFGVVIYGLVKKEKISGLVNAMMFSTGIAPLISDLLMRYPYAEVVGFHPAGFLMALVIGAGIGFFLPFGMAASPKIHGGFDLYSAALPVGMMAFLLQAMLFKTPGVALPSAPDTETLKVASPLIVNTFCCAVFGLCVIVALILGCTPKDYWELLKDPDQVTDFDKKYGNAVFLMNAGIYGLFILAYYNLVGASFNGVTFGIIFCMVSCCNSGAHPGNVWPIMAGYLIMSTIFRFLSPYLGGSYPAAINTQAILVGLCYASGLCPISDKYGWQHGVFAGALHYLMVTTVPALHGGFCLYNGGFTAALVCILLVPSLGRIFRTKQERRNLKATK